MIMAELGKCQSLSVTRISDFGIFVDAGELGEAMLLKSDGLPRCRVGEPLEVFLYLDSDDTLIATARKPRAQVGEFAALKVLSVNYYGAFLDWGLKKDLILPFSEQTGEVREGCTYIVRVFLDEKSGRIAATQKLEGFLDQTPARYQRHEEVDVVVAEQTDLGRKAIVNHAHWGLFYTDEIFSELRYGQHCKAYVKKVREDGKLDLLLHKPGYAKVEGIAEQILQKIQQTGGFLPLHDKSSPESIYQMFGVSKKTFKLGVSTLYKQRIIRLEKDGLYLNEDHDE